MFIESPTVQYPFGYRVSIGLILRFVDSERDEIKMRPGTMRMNEI